MENKENKKKEDLKYLFSSVFLKNNCFKKNYLIKDNFWTEEFNTTASSNFLLNFKTFNNSTVVNLLNKQQFFLLGKNIMDEFSCGGTGLTSNLGPIYNPYNYKHLVGGSSSGSAVSIAKKIASFAIVSDTGGSIRQPSSYCGIIGFKPSYGFISRFGLIPMSSSMDNVGIMANSISVIKEVLNIIAKADSNDLVTISFWKKKYKCLHNKKKIAIIKNIEDYLSINNLKLYKKTLNYLEEEYEIKTIEIPFFILDNLQFSWLTICFTELVSHLNSLQGITFGNKENIKIFEKRSMFLNSNVKKRLLIGTFLFEQNILEQFYFWREKVKKWIKKVFKEHLFLIFPSTITEAPKINQNSFVNLGSKNHWSENLLLLANLTNIPSLSLPIGFINDLPVSININSYLGNDIQVLNLAEKLFQKLNKIN